MRSQKQAESEDCDEVDIEHFEKILPQLVRTNKQNKQNLDFNALFKSHKSQSCNVKAGPEACVIHVLLRRARQGIVSVMYTLHPSDYTI